jgi:hypothetical protein
MYLECTTKFRIKGVVRILNTSFATKSVASMFVADFHGSMQPQQQSKSNQYNKVADLSNAGAAFFSLDESCKRPAMAIFFSV